MQVCRLKMLFILLLITVFKGILALQAPPDNNYYKIDEQFVVNKAENLHIFDDCLNKMKLSAFAEAVQDFLDHILTLIKYHKDKINKISNSYLLVFYEQHKDAQELSEIKEFWMKTIRNDNFIKTQPQITGHIMFKIDQVHKYIEEKFQKCKEMMLKIKTRRSYDEMLAYYEKNEYPGITILAIYCYDGLRYKTSKFMDNMFSDIVFDTIQREMPYFGLNYSQEIQYYVHD